MNTFTPKKGANHTIPIFKTNKIPAGVEMPAQSFLIKEAFQNTAWQTSEDSQAPHSLSGTPTYLHKRFLVRSGTIENLNVQGQSSDPHPEGENCLLAS